MLRIALLFIILMMNYFCERVAVSVCRTINCLFCEDFLPSAYLLLCDLGSGAYLLLCGALLEARKDCLWKRKFRFLQREYFASYKEKISLVTLWRKSTKVVKMPKQMHHFVGVIDRRIASSRLSYICYLEDCCDRQSHLSHFSCEKA